MSKQDRRSRLRAILDGERCVGMATVFDPVSARFAESLGYEAGLVGGSIMSHAVLGAPEPATRWTKVDFSRSKSVEAACPLALRLH